MDFGDALRALKDGKRVYRTGWNGRDMWLFLAMNISTGLAFLEVTAHMPRTPTICMKTAQETIVVGWLASQTDMLADDWAIL